MVCDAHESDRPSFAYKMQLMMHSDDKGAVFPPRVAEFQVAIVPVGLTIRTSDADRKMITEEAIRIGRVLSEAGIRVQCDTREHYSPGWKFNEYEASNRNHLGVTGLDN
jgi:prolyl-tRNA synthetase